MKPSETPRLDRLRPIRCTTTCAPSERRRAWLLTDKAHGHTLSLPIVSTPADAAGLALFLRADQPTTTDQMSRKSALRVTGTQN